MNNEYATNLKASVVGTLEGLGWRLRANEHGIFVYERSRSLRHGPTWRLRARFELFDDALEYFNRALNRAIVQRQEADEAEYR